MEVLIPIPKREAAERLADIFTELQRCFMAQLSRELGRGRVSFPQYLLLGHLSLGPLSMSQVAARMRHSTAAATGLVDRLEGTGHVRRAHSAEDRRKIMVEITEAGQALVNRVRADMVANVMNLMDLLTPEEQVTWVAIYEKVFAYCVKGCREP